MLKKLNVFTIYLVTFVFFFERFQLPFINQNSYFVVKPLLVYMLFVLWQKRKELFQKNQYLLMAMLIYVSTYTISAYGAVLIQGAFSETLLLITAVVSALFISVSLEGKDVMKVARWWIALSVVACLVRIFYLTDFGFLRTNIDSGLVSLFGREMWANISYHFLVEKQLMLVDTSHFFLPLTMLIYLFGKLNRKTMLVSGVMLFSLMSLNSRAYITAFIFVFLIIIVAVLKGIEVNPKRRLVGLIAIMSGLFVVVSSIMGLNVIQRLVGTDWDKLSGRKILAQEVWNLVSDRPLFGLGQRIVGGVVRMDSGAWNETYIKYLKDNALPSEYATPTAHSFVNIIVETGWVGFFAWVLMLVAMVVFDARRVMIVKNTKMGYLYLGLSLSMAFYLLSCITDVPSYAEIMTFWLIRGVLFSDLWLNKQV